MVVSEVLDTINNWVGTNELSMDAPVVASVQGTLVTVSQFHIQNGMLVAEFDF